MRYKKLIIVCLFLIEICTLFLTYKSYGNKILDNTKEEYKVDKKKYAMYIENDTGEYEEYTTLEKFPVGYKVNLDKSQCTDIKGNVINGILTGIGNKVTVTSNKTAYCYIYFDIDYKLSELCNSGDNLGSCLTDNNEEIDSLGDTAYSGMYRYTGTNEIVDDNYICFGTDDKDTCINNPETYMYRIIGVTSEANDTLGLETSQLKVIKYNSIGTHQWHNDYTSDTKWESSTMYTYLQNVVLNNTTYFPSGWSGKIDSVKWNVGVVETKTNGTIVNSLESSLKTINNSKLGLMYVSDYYFAYNSGGTLECTSNHCDNWLTPKTGDLWTMTRYGQDSEGRYRVFSVSSDGWNNILALNGNCIVHPVFYLNSEEQYISGSGTIDNPIMLADKEAPINNSVKINNNDTYTTSTNIALTLSSDGASEMCISESETCTNWESYTTSKNYTLSNALGIKTVYVTYKDKAGNETEKVSDTISLYEIVNVPSQNGSLTYTGSIQSPTWSNYDSNKITIGGTTSNTNAGTYNATFTPKTNYIWSDGTSEAKTVAWSMGKKANTLTLSATSGSVTYGSTKSFTIDANTSNGGLSVTSSDTTVATVSISGTTVTITSKKVGSSIITVTSAATTNYNSACKTYTITVNRASLTVPSQSGTLTFTGSSQSPSWNNYDSNKMNIGGTYQNQTNAGSYNASFTPKSNYQWSDGTTSTKTVPWSIGKTSGSLSVSPTSLTIKTGATGTITATRAGNGTVSATSSNTSVATVSVSGTTITVTGKAVGSATITVKVAVGTNHNAPANKTISVTVESNNYYLYDNGTSAVSLTMVNSCCTDDGDGSTATKYSGYMYLDTYYGSAGFKTSSKFDFTGYKKISVYWCAYENKTSCYTNTLDISNYQSSYYFKFSGGNYDDETGDKYTLLYLNTSANSSAGTVTRATFAASPTNKYYIYQVYLSKS